MARVNSTPKGTPANRKGANMKKQKKITPKKKKTLENKSEVKKETKTQTPEVKKEEVKFEAEMNAPQKTPEVKNVELTTEDIANNKFEELAVAVAYAKNDQEKEAAVKAFSDFFNGEIPDNKKAAIKEILTSRLKEDDFIYGSEFIDLTGLRQYQDKLFEKQPSVLEDKIAETTPVKNTEKKEKTVSPSLSEKELYQALVDGINNEEIKNIKGYSKEDLEKILDYQDKLLNGQDNGTAFESLHENSISDLKKFAEGTMTVDNDSYETMLQFIKVFGTNYKGELTPEGKAAYDKLMDLMAQAKKEKIMKNKEDYQKKAGVVEDVKDKANATVAGIVGGLAANAAEKEKTVSPSLSGKELYQALVDGINNEEIKNIKGYSKEDLEKILDYQDKLLNGQDNGTAFESLHENSISDLKKFAEGTMTVDNDSYETMLQFIKVFGTNHKGELTPEGKAAYDKLMDLMAQAKKEKIMKNEEDYQKKAGVVEDVKDKDKDKDKANATVAGIVGGLAANAAEKEKTPKDSDFVIGMETPDDVNTNTNTKDKPEKGNEKTPVIGVVPVPPTQTNSGGNPPVPPSHTNSGGNPPVPPVPPSNDLPTGGKRKEPEKKKGWWGRLKDKVKRNWKKIVGWTVATVTAAALLFMPKNCSGNDGTIPPNQDDGKNNLPDKEVVVTPTPQDTITLDQNDLSNGFYLERSAGFKAEQEKINFHDAEKANKTDLLTIKKLLAHGDLEQSKFVRNSTSKDDKPISVPEIAYKMRIVTQNFPKSKVAASINNMFSGKVSAQDADNIYAAFNHVNDLGYIVNNKGKIIDGTTVKKTIDPVRMGPGSEEYGTKGADNNFLQVLKNHRDTLNK